MGGRVFGCGALALILAPVALLGRAEATGGAFAPPSYIGALDPYLLWEILICGLVVLSFAAALALWTATRMRRMRRTQLRRSVFINSVLNNLGQGLVMVDAEHRVIFCNDRYLQMYGLKREDIRVGMRGRELIDLRRRRGTIAVGADEYFESVNHPEGYISEQPDGRAILIRHQPLPSGGTIATHDDVTDLRRLSTQLAQTKSFLESLIDNIPVCVAAKSIHDGRYILVNRAYEKFSRMSRDQVIGKTPFDIYGEKTAQHVSRVDEIAIANPDAPLRTEYTVERNGKTLTLATNRVIARDENNEPQFLIALFEDISERLALSKELERTKKFLELVLDNIPIALTVQSVEDGRYLLARRAVRAQGGADDRRPGRARDPPRRARDRGAAVSHAGRSAAVPDAKASPTGSRSSRACRIWPITTDSPICRTARPS